MLRKVLLSSFIIAVVALSLPQIASLHAMNWPAADQTPLTRAAVSQVFAGDVTSTGPEVREDFSQTYPFTANGRIVLENINGGVKITVWDRNEVQLTAVKRAFNRERLAQAQIDVAATGDALRIKTRYPEHNQSFYGDEKGRHNNPASVDYTLTVPRQTRLESIDLINGALDVDGVEGDVTCSSINGRVTAKGLMGSAKLSTVNGGLEAVFTRMDETKAISLNSVNGSVSLMIPSNANALVRASTVHGDIANDFGLNVSHGEYVGHELHGQIGTGGPRIRIGNVNGRIWIKRNPDGGKLSAAVSLLSQEEKDVWQKDKIKGAYSEELKELNAANRRLAEEIKKDIAGETRAARQVRIDAQREAARAIREAQNEIRRAQLEIQREMHREIRQQAREEARAEGHATGAGAGAGARAGTGSATAKGVGSGVGRRVFTFRESKSFAVTGTSRVNVITYDGTIIVRGWDKPEVMYTAIKRVNDEAEAKDIEIKSEQQGSSVSIIAASPEGSGSVNLEVFVPRSTSLHVSSGDGQLTLDGVSGDLTLRTGDGSVEVSNASGQLRVNTGDGPIKIGRFEGQLDARTGDGPIALDGKFVSLAARTGSGSVILAIPADSNFTIETDAEEVTNEGLTLTEDLAPSKRVKRWKVGSGGKVFVINTGDGKILVRRR